MSYLLDTCVFLWLCAEPQRLSGAAKQILDAQQNVIHLSHVSHLEISLKWAAGRIRLPQPPRSWISQQVRAWHIKQVPLTLDEIYRSVELPKHHRDPFDRLLVSSAICRNMTILTQDASVQQYDVAWTW